MAQDLIEQIYKSALLLEMRGKSFYRKVATDAENTAVKEFFNMMAADEAKHIQILSDHYRTQLGKQAESQTPFKPMAITDISSFVFTNRLSEKIAAASFEASAISAAILMEKNAVQLYSQHIATAKTPAAQTLYEWLTKWESEHLNALSELDRKLTEQIWLDNKFWPF